MLPKNVRNTIILQDELLWGRNEKHPAKGGAWCGAREPTSLGMRPGMAFPAQAQQQEDGSVCGKCFR